MTPADFHSTLDGISRRFQGNIKSINDLLTFDEIIQLVCTQALKKIRKAIQYAGDLNPLRDCQNELTTLENIRVNDSLAPYYTMMHNQCVVLLVSYFSSIIEALCITSLAWKLSQPDAQDLPNDAIRLSLSELIAISNDTEAVAQLVIDKRDISFQDTKSIAKAFNDYFRISIEKDQTVNNIILALACRHAIVHNGAVANTNTLRQIRAATPRDLKCDLSDGSFIHFNLNEIEIVIGAMTSYVENLIRALKTLWQIT